MSQLICLDASLIIRYLSNLESQSIYHQYWQQWKINKDILVAPTLILYEVTNAFYRIALAGEITTSEAERFLERALNLGLRLYGDAQLHQEALKVAQQYHLSAAYDAHYLALAKRLGSEFWTADQRLYNAVCDSLDWVHLLK